MFCERTFFSGLLRSISADVGAQGLLGDVESIGGFCEAALLSGHEKVVHGKKVHIKPPEYKKER